MLSEVEIKARIQGMGERLKEGRELRGLDQLSVSRESGISRAMISDFERGERAMMAEHIFKLSDSLKIRPEWLLTGDGVMATEGPSLSRIRDEAWNLRIMEVDFISAINALLRKFRNDQLRMTWALGSCIRAYWGAHWLGMQDMREVARIVERVSEACGLNLVDVLESTGHSNASQYTADWLVHKGIDPEAFGPELQGDGFNYEVKYRPELVRSEKVLGQLAIEKGLVQQEKDFQPKKVDQVVDYFVRLLGIRKR
jgi:transcriptional regulator with XRE-family HTH domain